MKEEYTSRQVGDFTVARYFAFVGGSDCERITLVKTTSIYLAKKGYSVAILKEAKDNGALQEIIVQQNISYEGANCRLIAYISSKVISTLFFGKDQGARIFQLAEDTMDFILLDGFENFPDTPKVVILGANEPGEHMGVYTVALIGIHEKTQEHPLYKAESELPVLVENLALPPNRNLNCEKCGFPNCKAFRAMVLKGKASITDCVTYGSRVRLCVNEKDIALVPFTQKLVESVVSGMVRPLHIPDEEIRKIQITIEKPDMT